MTLQGTFLPRDSLRINTHQVVGAFGATLCRAECRLEYRAVLAQRLIGNSHGLTVVIGGTNTNTINATVSNSFTIQIGGTAEQVSEQLKNIPDRVFEELIEAIATRLREGEGK